MFKKNSSARWVKALILTRALARAKDSVKVEATLQIKVRIYIHIHSSLDADMPMKRFLKLIMIVMQSWRIKAQPPSVLPRAAHNAGDEY